MYYFVPDRIRNKNMWITTIHGKLLIVLQSMHNYSLHTSSYIMTAKPTRL